LKSVYDPMENTLTENDIANQKIAVYVAIKKIISDGHPVTIYGISMITNMTTSYIWTTFGLRGDLMSMIDDAEKNESLR
jgi:hypothetical protein